VPRPPFRSSRTEWLHVWRHHRQVINAILRKLRTGAPGGTCLSATDPGRPPTNGSRSGPPTHLGTHPRRGHRQRRLCRERGVDLQHRLQQRPGPPAFGWGPEKGAAPPRGSRTLPSTEKPSDGPRGGLTSSSTPPGWRVRRFDSAALAEVCQRCEPRVMPRGVEIGVGGTYRGSTVERRPEEAR